jgi:hypothetical protein
MASGSSTTIETDICWITSELLLDQTASSSSLLEVSEAGSIQRFRAAAKHMLAG